MKDPAFLFYSSDFLTGVSDLTMEERGQFITLLCLQHQKGELSEKTIKINTPNVTQCVLNKFAQRDDGVYVNDKLAAVVSERKKHGQHQKVKAFKTNAIIKLKKIGRSDLIDLFKKTIDSEMSEYISLSEEQIRDKVNEVVNRITKENAQRNAQRTPLENEIEIENISKEDKEKGVAQFSNPTKPIHEHTNDLVDFFKIIPMAQHLHVKRINEWVYQQEAEGKLKHIKSQLLYYAKLLKISSRMKCGWTKWITENHNICDWKSTYEEEKGRTVEKSSSRHEITEGANYGGN